MDPQSEAAPDLDYLLGGGSGGGAGGGGGAGDDPVPALFDGQPSSLADASSSAAQDPQAAQSAQPPTSAAGAAAAAAAQQTSRKRPLDDKKARDKKRILRNRELARVSNERRKGRIKAMETELEDTRKTVSNLEESIRSLEAENNDLKSLLENRPGSRL